MPAIEILSTGRLDERDSAFPQAVQLPDGDVLCSFSVGGGQHVRGGTDWARSSDGGQTWTLEGTILPPTADPATTILPEAATGPGFLVGKASWPNASPVATGRDGARRRGSRSSPSPDCVEGVSAAIPISGAIPRRASPPCRLLRLLVNQSALFSRSVRGGECHLDPGCPLSLPIIPSLAWVKDLRRRVSCRLSYPPRRATFSSAMHDSPRLIELLVGTA